MRLLLMVFVTNSIDPKLLAVGSGPLNVDLCNPRLFNCVASRLAWVIQKHCVYYSASPRSVPMVSLYCNHSTYTVSLYKPENKAIIYNGNKICLHNDFCAVARYIKIYNVKEREICLFQKLWIWNKKKQLQFRMKQKHMNTKGCSHWKQQ